MDATSDLPTLAATAAGARQSKANRLGDLQAFQARIAEKIANAQATTTLGQSLLAVQVGGYGVHIPLHDMSALLAMPEISPMPLAQQWLKGLAVVRAEVLTVLDLAYCLHTYIGVHMPDLAQASSSTKHLFGEQGQSSQTRLLIINPLIQNQLAVLVDKVLGIVSADTLSPYSLSSASGDPVIKRASIDVNGTVFIELSLGELFKSATFLKLNY